MEHMSKQLPFVSWELYLNFLRKKQGVHESEQPEVVFDELIILQVDENLGRDRIRAFENGEKSIGNSHEIDVECYPHGYKLEYVFLDLYFIFSFFFKSLISFL